MTLLKKDLYFVNDNVNWWSDIEQAQSGSIKVRGKISSNRIIISILLSIIVILAGLLIHTILTVQSVPVENTPPVITHWDIVIERSNFSIQIEAYDADNNITRIFLEINSTDSESTLFSCNKSVNNRVISLFCDHDVPVVLEGNLSASICIFDEVNASSERLFKSVYVIPEDPDIVNQAPIILTHPKISPVVYNSTDDKWYILFFAFDADSNGLYIDISVYGKYCYCLFFSERYYNTENEMMWQANDSMNLDPGSFVLYAEARDSFGLTSETIIIEFTED